MTVYAAVSRSGYLFMRDTNLHATNRIARIPINTHVITTHSLSERATAAKTLSMEKTISMTSTATTVHQNDRATACVLLMSSSPFVKCFTAR